MNKRVNVSCVPRLALHASWESRMLFQRIPPSARFSQKMHACQLFWRSLCFRSCWCEDLAARSTYRFLIIVLTSSPLTRRSKARRPSVVWKRLREGIFGVAALNHRSLVVHFLKACSLLGQASCRLWSPRRLIRFRGESERKRHSSQFQGEWAV